MKHLNTLLLTSVSAALLMACAPKEVAEQARFVNASELATPFIHNGDTSIFRVTDYSLNPSAILGELPTGLHSLEREPGVYALFGDSESGLGTLTVVTSEGNLSVPFIKGAKQQITLNVPAFAGQDVKVKGEFNAWNAEASFLKWQDTSWQWTLSLEPGEYAYKMVVNGEEVLDPSNLLQEPNGFGSFNNVLSVPALGEREPHDLEFLTADQDELLFNPLPEDQELLFFFNDQVIPHSMSPLATTVAIPEQAAQMERSWIRAYTYRDGKRGNDWLIPLKYGKVVLDARELDRRDWHTSIMYFTMIDRFHNGNTTNDAPVPDSTVHPRANYQGGDIAGLRAKMLEGYFDSLHTNTLWISPITENPKDAWGLWNQGGPVSTFSGYHGYWPISNIRPDQRFATPEELHTFLNDAHAKSQNVLLDYVANHVHQDHPVYQQHPDWATPKYTADGRLNTQLWDEERLTTWFDNFMPTLELRNEEVAELMSDSAMVWLTEYPFDGFRHDATKHIPENFTRLLTQKIRQLDRPNYVYQIGETYGSDELIASYVRSGMLDAQFNFNLYDAAFEAFTQEGATFDRLRKALESSLKYYGHHHLMGNISGNQDKPRFSSMASGHLSPGEDTKLAGWTREIPEPTERGYRKMAAMHAFNIAVPGIPILYYGDEIALHGGNDPDNRKMMPFQWSERQQQLFDRIARMNEVRANTMALNYGSTTVHQPDPHVLIIVRRYMEQEVRFFFNNSAEDRRLEKWDITVPADGEIYQTRNCGQFFK